MSAESSVLAHLRRGRSEWPESLVLPSIHARLTAAAPKLPEPITGLFIECHLSDPARTDFGVRLSRQDRDASLRSGQCPEPFKRFFALWRDEKHPASQLQSVDIEYDMGKVDTEPFISPALEPDFLAGFEAIERRTRRERAAGRKRLALELGPPVLRALDPTLPDALFAQIERCTEALPAYGLLIPVWSGISRPGVLAEPSIRVTIALPRLALRGYLSSLGWTGDMDRLEHYADMLIPSSPWVGFDADILQGGLGLRTGLYQEHWWVRPWDTDLQDTIQRLERLGLCVPERFEGFRAWVESQPERPRPGEARSLSLKLVLNGETSPVVKAYISTFDEALAVRQLPRQSGESMNRANGV